MWYLALKKEAKMTHQQSITNAAKNQQWEIVKTIAQSRKANSHQDRADYDDALIAAMRAKE